MRKNIFQLVDENYNIQNEIRKINKLLFEEKYFREDDLFDLTLEKLLEENLFIDWKYRGTCLTVKGFMSRVGALVDYKDRQTGISEERIINNLECIENFIKLYFDNSNDLCAKNSIKYYGNFEKVFCSLVDVLEKRMGLVTKKIKDKIVIIPKNAPLEQVINICEDQDVQWEMIQYAREKLSLSEKRKSLAYLATNLYIEQDKKETNPILIEVIGQATNVLNNLHIRHNNMTGKWEKSEVIKNISDKEAKQLCDFVFNKMLIIVLLRENEKYEPIYQKFNAIQKSGKKVND